MNNVKTLTCILATAVGLAIGGCAGGPTPTERNFGDSVRQMIRAQTYDPATLTSPSDEPVDRTDGQLLERSLESYRNDVGDRESVNDRLVIGADGGAP